MKATCRCDCGTVKDIGVTKLKFGTKSCGCLHKKLSQKRIVERNVASKIRCHIGGVYGRLTVVQSEDTALCICSCGAKIRTAHHRLRSGHLRSCGCLVTDHMRELGRKSAKSPGESAANCVFLRYRNSSKKRQIPFDLSKNFFREQIFKNCFYCGAPPSNENKSQYNSGSVIYSGLDRIDNSKGYTTGNCVPCCHTCNVAKNKHSLNEFKEWLYRASDFMRARENT